MKLIPAKEAVFPTEKSKYVIGQTFSKEDTDRLINISSHDYFVKQHVLGYQMLLTPDGGPYANVSYVTAAKYLECVPDGKPSSLLNPPVYRVLPVIVYSCGDPEYEGINVSVFIDPDKKYAPYIGYTVRPGKKGNYTYTTSSDGVDYTRDIDPKNDRFIISAQVDNFSIRYTGNIPPKNSMQDQKEEMIGIILNNSYIANRLKGYEYRFSDVYGGELLNPSGAGDYYEVYPSIIIIDRSTSARIMRVEVDLRDKKVVTVF